MVLGARLGNRAALSPESQVRCHKGHKAVSGARVAIRRRLLPSAKRTSISGLASLPETSSITPSPKLS